MERVEDVVFEELLVGDADFDWMRGGAVLAVPGFDEWDVDGATCTTRALVVWTTGPEEGDAVGCVVVVQWRF